MTLEEQGQSAWRNMMASIELGLPNATFIFNREWLDIQEQIKERGKNG